MRNSFCLRIGLFVFSILLIGSCKDDALPDVTPEIKSERVLSKIYRDGKLEAEFTYGNADAAGTTSQSQCTNNLKQIGISLYDTTYNRIISNILYEYDDKTGLERELVFTEGGEVFRIVEYAKDNSCQPASADVKEKIPGVGLVLTKKQKTEYNTQNQIVRETLIEHDSGLEKSYTDYVYYPNGSLKSSETYTWLNNNYVKTREVLYTSSGVTLPETVSRYSNFPFKYLLNYLAAKEVRTKTYTLLGVESDILEEITGQQRDEHGFIRQQTVTTTDMLAKEKKGIVSTISYDSHEIEMDVHVGK